MKRIVMAFFLLFALAMGKTAQSQQLKFYYYPSANVYYDPVNNQYIYFQSGNWTPVRVLPSGMLATGASRVIVYSKTPQVWVMNKEHVVKYKNTPNGKAVGYKGTNPNKANGKNSPPKKNKAKG